jgi:hypothetical protein
MMPASAFDLVVVNQANFSVIHKLYLAPAKSNQWGENKLQNQTVAKKRASFSWRPFDHLVGER